MKKITAILAACAILVSGCGIIPDSGMSEPGDVKADERLNEDGKSAGAEQPAAETKEAVDLDLKPNEAGRIMVLMYHNIGSEEKEWVRTPENFMKDLGTLYEKGYRPISLHDYVTGDIATEQGFTPVVITFDDGNLNNFAYLDDGSIDEECAVALLMDFHEEHPDFPLEATFFLDGDRPFKQSGLISQKLNFIIDNGMDIGNHTKNHLNLSNASAQEIQDQIGSQAEYLERLIDKDGYRVDALALPYGERPKAEGLEKYLISGSSGGDAYDNIAVLNVGWNPGRSPYNREFDAYSIPRVRASETNVDNVGLYDYIEYFDRHPEQKFVSDGMPGIVTVPSDQKESIANLLEKELYIYETE